MMRTLGGFLRGSHAPIQVFLAALLGSLLGFAPGFSAAPGLIALLLVLLIVLNANIGIALLVFGLAKLLSLVAMPVSFAIGEFLLDGPLRGLMETVVNAPVLALGALDHYAVSGGQVLGLLFGVFAGWFLVTTLNGFRAKMHGLEEGSERYKKLTSKPGMGVLLWILIGSGHGKKSYGELLSKRKRFPIRIMGAVLALIVILGVVFVPGLLGGVITNVSRDNLAQWNGATVDLEGVELDLASNRLVVHGLAMADPNALGTNLFEAARMEANLSSSDLLRGHLAIDRLSIIDGAQGLARANVGSHVGPPPKPSETPDAEGGDGDSRSLEDWLADAQVWRERLATVREWVERFAPAEEGESEETLEERLEREVAEKGWLGVVSRGLRRDDPALLIRELVADGVRSASLTGETLNVRFDNLSTAPELVLDPARLRITSSAGSLDVDVAMGGLTADKTDNRLLFALSGVTAEALADSLKIDGKPLLSKGTLDVALDGAWAGGKVGWLDLPLNVTFHDMLVNIGGSQAPLDGLTLPLGIRGPLDSPRVTLDDDAVTDLLKGTALAEFNKRKDELEQKGQEKLDEKTDELKEKLGDKVGDELGDKLGDKLGGLFGSKKKDKKSDEDG
ncbi:MAG: membrane protein [Planctomycetota bacterium]|nr:MAG: membrane protein [Planctomycetota bacterium]